MSSSVEDALSNLDYKINNLNIKKEIIKYVDNKYGIVRVLDDEYTSFKNDTKKFNDYKYCSAESSDNTRGLYLSLIEKDSYKNFTIYIEPPFSSLLLIYRENCDENNSVYFRDIKKLNLSDRLTEFIEQKQKEEFYKFFIKQKNKNPKFEYSLSKFSDKPEWFDTIDIFS